MNTFLKIMVCPTEQTTFTRYKPFCRAVVSAIDAPANAANMAAAMARSCSFLRCS